MSKAPTHMTHDSGYFDPHVNSFCGLGDGFDKGFENGTTDWNKVTCKKCLTQKQ